MDIPEVEVLDLDATVPPTVAPSRSVQPFLYPGENWENVIDPIMEAVRRTRRSIEGHVEL